MPQSSAERLARYTAGLAAAGLKFTGQRRAICMALAEAPGHPTVQHVFEMARQKAPAISLATVYNTMAVFKGLGLVFDLGMDDGDGTLFELDPHPHAHLRCSGCKQVFDLHLTLLDAFQAEVEQQTGFQVAESHIFFTGLCDTCRAS